jgi:hypothetical protein
MGRKGGEGRWKGRKRIGKENVHAASRRVSSVRPPLAFLLSPCLATTHTWSSLHSARIFIHLHQPAALRRIISPIYTAQIVQLPVSTLHTAWLGQPPVNAMTPWLLTPCSPWSKVFRLLQ